MARPKFRIMRIEQPAGSKGSLRWIQRSVAERWQTLEAPILARTGAASLRWHSPLAIDAFAEYRDEAFLGLIGKLHLADPLHGFWPARGPQWDAVGQTDSDAVVLVEAKAQIAELLSPPTAASEDARRRIETALADVAERIAPGRRRAPWTEHFYQLAIRLAHLDFLRRHEVEAWLVLVDFVGDAEVGGPKAAEAWDAAYEVAFHVMGLPKRHALSPYILHVRPDVRGDR